jgi:hypothetical protein
VRLNILLHAQITDAAVRHHRTMHMQRLLNMHSRMYVAWLAQSYVAGVRVQLTCRDSLDDLSNTAATNIINSVY